MVCIIIIYSDLVPSKGNYCSTSGKLMLLLVVQASRYVAIHSFNKLLITAVKVVLITKDYYNPPFE